MTSEGNILPRFLELQKVLMSSLRLKDALDAAVHMFTEMAGGAKVALFLADNESMTFKLMAARGYSDGSLDQMRIVPFGIESLLKYVQQKRIPITTQDASTAPDLSAAIMRRETSKGQIGLPMIAGNTLVGAVLMEVNNPQIIAFADFLKEVAISNSLKLAPSKPLKAASWKFKLSSSSKSKAQLGVLARTRAVSAATCRTWANSKLLLLSAHMQ